MTKSIPLFAYQKLSTCSLNITQCSYCLILSCHSSHNIIVLTFKMKCYKDECRLCCSEKWKLWLKTSNGCETVNDWCGHRLLHVPKHRKGENGEGLLDWRQLNRQFFNFIIKWTPATKNTQKITTCTTYSTKI